MEMGVHEAFALIQFVSEHTSWVPLFAINGFTEETLGVGSGNFYDSFMLLRLFTIVCI